MNRRNVFAAFFATVFFACTSTPPQPEPPQPPVSQAPLRTPSPTPAPSPAPKGARKKAPAAPKAGADSHDSSDGEAASAEDVVIRCQVRLPDDSDDHPELCGEFRVVVSQLGKGEVERFRFNSEGEYRFRAKAGKTYTLKPLVGKSWKVEVGPKNSFRAGDEIETKFTQSL